MKHQSILIVALLLGATPLCAMALDYGPTSPLLAAGTSAQQLSMPTAAGNDTTRPEIADADTDDASDAGAATAAPDAPHAAPSGAPSRTSAIHSHAPPARGKVPAQPATHPAAPATATSWQSLLPGSIQ